MTARKNQTKFDLIIIGGGLVGASLLLALKNARLRIALVDARLPSNDDPRLFALNLSSCQFLENIHIWDKLKDIAAPINKVHVSFQGRFGAVRLNKEDVQLSSLGHVIPAHYIEEEINAALQLLSNSAQFELLRPARLQALQQTDDEVQLTIQTENGIQEITADFVIGADGTDSTVRALSHFDCKQKEDPELALVTRTKLNRPHDGIAYERFQNHGAIAMLPLKGEECATIWTGARNKINELMLLSDADFLQALQKEFGYRLGRLQSITKRHQFPLKTLQVKDPVNHRIYLIGNAAHTLHPIAAQGFNLALYEVAILAEEILLKGHKGDPFTPKDLQHITKHTQNQQANSIGVSERLPRLFESRSTLLHLLLQLGMVTLDHMVPLKKRFIKGMLGRAGLVPRLLLGESDF